MIYTLQNIVLKEPFTNGELIVILQGWAALLWNVSQLVSLAMTCLRSTIQVFLKILEELLELALRGDVNLLCVGRWCFGKDLWHKEIISLYWSFAAGRNPEAVAIAVHPA